MSTDAKAINTMLVVVSWYKLHLSTVDLKDMEAVNISKTLELTTSNKLDLAFAQNQSINDSQQGEEKQPIYAALDLWGSKSWMI